MCYVPLAFQCVHGWGNERSENGDKKNRSEIFRRRENGDCLASLLYPNYLVLYNESEGHHKVMVGHSVKVCNRRV